MLCAFTDADVIGRIVAEVGRLSALYVCVYVCNVYVYVSTLKQNPLDVSSPKLADG